MPNRLTVDGLPHSFTDENLKNLFASYGRVLRAAMTRIAHPHVMFNGMFALETHDIENEDLPVLLSQIDEPRVYPVGMRQVRQQIVPQDFHSLERPRAEFADAMLIIKHEGHWRQLSLCRHGMYPFSVRPPGVAPRSWSSLCHFTFGPNPAAMPFHHCFGRGKTDPTA